MGRYYVRFEDGKSSWVGPLPLEYEQYEPVIVAFGESFTSYFILFEDGRMSYADLPRSLHNKLHSRNPRLPGVEFLSLGPDGEWFVLWKTGKMEWGGPVDAEVERFIYRHSVRQVYFGTGSVTLVRYNDN